MFSPTARCDSLNDRFWCLIIVARHRNFWAPGGFLVDFGGNSANAQVQFEWGFQRSSDVFPDGTLRFLK